MGDRSIEDAAFDAMLSQAAKEALPVWLEQMENEYQVFEVTPVSKTLDKKIRSITRKLNNTNKWSTASKTAFRFAAALILVLTIGVGLIVNVEAVRVEVINFLLDWRETHVTLGTATAPTKADTRGWEYAPDYIPEGFELVNVIDLQDVATFEYRSEDGGYLSFGWNDMLSTSISVDTEQRSYTSIILNERPAHLFTAESDEYYSSLYWDDGTMLFGVTSTLPTDEIIRIAESVVKIS